MSQAADAEEKLRFEAELEFVQSLANPEYLHHLAQNRYFDDPMFTDYLDYLQYWREAPYCQYIVFPHCLRMLELLCEKGNSTFLEALKRVDYKEFLNAEQHAHWRRRGLAPRDAADAYASKAAGGSASASASGGGAAG